MATFEGMKIPPEMKSYIKTTLEPLLEDMVTECLTDQPEDPIGFLLGWLEKQAGAKPKGDSELTAENEKLKQEIETLKGWQKDIGSAIKDEKAAEEEEEEEEDDDMELEEPPPAPVRGNRQSVSAEAYGEWNKVKTDFVPPVIPKTDEQKANILKTISGSFLFAALEDEQRAKVIDAMSEVTLTKGDRVIKQGEDGDFLFVIEKGSCDCFKLMPGETEEKFLKTCAPGDVFGELALLYNLPRAASVEATEVTSCWRLDRQTFNHIVRSAATEKRERNLEVLKKVPLLSAMEGYELGQIADALYPESCESGTNIVTAGEPGDKFYILVSGSAEAKKSIGGEEKVVMSYTEGMFFGELALLKNEPRAATVTATSKCKLLWLDRGAFRRLLGSVDQLLNVSYA
jgi:cAMP-dependent protein kinase regulator